MPGVSAFGTALYMHDGTVRTIVEVDTLENSFEVSGDVTAQFPEGMSFKVVASSDNDGDYTTLDSSYDAGLNRTTIFTVENITSGTADGFIQRWPLVAHVDTFSGPSLSVDAADVTSHDSPDRWEEVVPTVVRSGEITFDINYDPEENSHQLLIEAYETGVFRDFEVWFPVPSPGGTVWTLGGYVNGFEPSAPHDDKLAAAATVKPSGTASLS